MTNSTENILQPTNENLLFKLIKELPNTTPNNVPLKPPLTVALLDSPLGRLVAVTNTTSLLALQCLDFSKIARKLKLLVASQKRCLQIGRNKIIDQLDTELTSYFSGKLSAGHFRTPIQMIGTEFQVSVWNRLRTTTNGQRVAYKTIATSIGQPNAVRAVANAIGSNPLLIIVPCHRIVASDGNLGGFSCGLHRKKLLLALESPT